MQTETSPILIPANPLTPALIQRIIEGNTGENAAEIIRAINGTTSPQTRVIGGSPGADWAGVAMWLAIGAAAVAWILTHSA